MITINGFGVVDSLKREFRMYARRVGVYEALVRVMTRFLIWSFGLVWFVKHWRSVWYTEEVLSEAEFVTLRKIRTKNVNIVIGFFIFIFVIW